MTRSNPDPIGRPSGVADALNALNELLAGRRKPDATTADNWERATHASSTAPCEAAGHRYQVVGRHKPTEVRCAEPDCGAGPWPVGGAR